jgi:hypothetical protein
MSGAGLRKGKLLEDDTGMGGQSIVDIKLSTSSWVFCFHLFISRSSLISFSIRSELHLAINWQIRIFLQSMEAMRHAHKNEI